MAGESLYRIKRYDGLAIQSVEVQIHDDDRPGLVVDETKSFEDDGDMMDDPVTDVVEDLQIAITPIDEHGFAVGATEVVDIQAVFGRGTRTTASQANNKAELL